MEKKKEGKNNTQNKTTNKNKKTNYKSEVEGEDWIYCISRAKKKFSSVWFVKENGEERYVSKYLPPSPPKLYLPKIWRK